MRLLFLLCGLIACESRSQSRSTGGEGTGSSAPALADPIRMDPPAGPGAMAPNVHATTGAVFATWLEPSGRGHRLRLSRWQNGKWSAAVTIAENDRIVANWADVPAVARGGDGALVASWAEASGPDAHAYDAVVARSTDVGATWKPLGPLHDDGTATEHGFVSLAPESAGVRAFWLDGRSTAAGGPMTLRTARVDSGITKGAIMDDRVCDCCGTAAAPTGTGVAVVYRDRSADEVRDIWLAGTDGAAPAAVHSDGWRIQGCPVNGPALAAAGSRLVVAWYSYAESTHRVRAAFSADDGASFGPAIEIDGLHAGRAPLGRVGVLLDRAGAAWISWLASDREAGVLLMRRVAPDGRKSPEIRVASTVAGRDAGFPRLARLGDDAVLLWTEPGSPSHVRAARVPLGERPTVGDQSPAVAERPARTAAAVAPSLSATTLVGAPTSLASLRGQVVLVNLWATWCEPCRHELPELAMLHEREHGRGLTVIGLNVDRQRSREEIAEFVARRKLPFPVWVDADDRAPTALQVATYPTNILLDRDGQVVWRRDGAIRADDAELVAALDAALGPRK